METNKDLADILLVAKDSIDRVLAAIGKDHDDEQISADHRELASVVCCYAARLEGSFNGSLR